MQTSALSKLKTLPREAWAFVAYPWRRVVRWYRLGRARRRFALVHEVARQVRREEAEERNRTNRIHVILRPESWPGLERVCEHADGGCGTLQRFGPLKMQRISDHEVWKLICPGCRKQRVVLSTTPGVRRMQAAALEEFRRTGQFGDAYRRFETAVAAHNRRMAEVRRGAVQRGPGNPAEATSPGE